MKREEAVEEMMKVINHFSGTRISDEELMFEILNSLEHVVGMSAPTLPLKREDFDSDLEFKCAQDHAHVFGEKKGWE